MPTFLRGTRLSCLLCQASVVQQGPLCAGCYRDLPWRSETLSVQALPIQVAFDYAWPIDRLIHLYKYQERLDLMHVLLHGLIQLQRPAVDALLAVPLSDARLRARGFNQSQELAKRLSDQWQIPLLGGITRVDGLRQKGLSRAERMQNVEDIFRVEGPSAQPFPRRVALIDDVLTTGSTLLSLAQFLKHQGVVEVAGIVVASRKSR